MDSAVFYSANGDPDSSSSARSARQPEESGPFGRNRSTRATGSRASRTRTGTTPVRQKESSAVSDFGKLFAKEQEREAERTKSTLNTPSADAIEPELVPTECLLYGYAGKSSEWKVLSKFEKIVSPGFICEDYSREDPNLFLSSNSPLAFSRSSIVVRNNLSREAIKKSRVYMGGQHWIKVTFDSYQAAERAIHYSPVEIDGYLVHCEMWSGKGPLADAAMPIGPEGQDSASLIRPDSGRKVRTLSASRSANILSGSKSALAGFERAYQTLPKSQTLPDLQFRQPGALDDASVTSTTASSATATEFSPPPQSPTGTSNLRSRSVPSLPARKVEDLSQSEYMTHIKVKKAVLRPISEALPPQPSFGERILRSIPIVSWFVGGNKGTAGNAGIIGEGPLLREDGSWDPANGWYWSFWHNVDYFLKTDFCGLKDD